MSKLFGVLHNSPIENLDLNANSHGTIQSAPQTWNDAFQDGVYKAYTALGINQDTARRHSQTFGDLIEFTPYQSVMDIADYTQGNGNALDAGLASIDFVPGIGKATTAAAKNIFAGAKAAERLGKLNAMREAEKMLSNGMDERDVWNKTGFFRGDDGMMRFEIDDSKAKPNFGVGVYGEGIKDKEWSPIIHKSLAKAYPEHEKIMFDLVGNERKGGSFAPAVPATSDTFGKAPEITIDGGTIVEQFSTGLHELQHATQHAEGFSRGSNPLNFTDALANMKSSAFNNVKYINENLSKLAKKLEAEPDNATYKKSYDYLLTQREQNAKIAQMDINKEAFDRYQRKLGEAEARLVEKRLKYSPDQRKAIFPYDDLDVPRGELWIGDKGHGNISKNQGVLSMNETALEKIRSGKKFSSEDKQQILSELEGTKAYESAVSYLKKKKKKVTNDSLYSRIKTQDANSSKFNKSHNKISILKFDFIII